MKSSCQNGRSQRSGFATSAFGGAARGAFAAASPRHSGKKNGRTTSCPAIQPSNGCGGDVAYSRSANSQVSTASVTADRARTQDRPAPATMMVRLSDLRRRLRASARSSLRQRASDHDAAAARPAIPTDQHVTSHSLRLSPAPDLTRNRRCPIQDHRHRRPSTSIAARNLMPSVIAAGLLLRPAHQVGPEKAAQVGEAVEQRQPARRRGAAQQRRPAGSRTPPARHRCRWPPRRSDAITSHGLVQQRRAQHAGRRRKRGEGDMAGALAAAGRWRCPAPPSRPSPADRAAPR